LPDVGFCRPAETVFSRESFMNENTQDTPVRIETAMPFQPAEGETAAALEGFHCYFEMPKDVRSLKKVAEQLGYNESTVREWSAKFGWRDRILKYQTRLLNTRIESDAAATKELALAKVEREGLRRQKNTRLSTFFQQLGEKLLEHYLLTGLDKIKFPDVLKIFELALKIDALSADNASTDANEQEKSTLIAEIEASLKRIKIPGTPELLNQLAHASNGSTPTPEGGK
jgi:hypothetical protein